MPTKLVMTWSKVSFNNHTLTSITGVEAEPKAVPLGEFGDDWPSEEMIQRVVRDMELYYQKDALASKPLDQRNESTEASTES